MSSARKIVLPNRRRFLRAGLVGGMGVFLGTSIIRPKRLMAGGSWTGQVSASSDDDNGSSGAVTTPIVHLKTVDGAFLGFRWTGVDVPQGATITSATHSIYCPSSRDSDPHQNMWCQACDNAPTFTTTSGPGDSSARPGTTAYVNWGNFAQTTVGWNAAPDMSAPIQEVINRPGWVSGNALVIIWQGDGGGGPALAVEMWDGDSTEAAILEIVYS